MIHLDTGFLIRALVAGSPEDRILQAWIRNGETLGISAIVWAEFLCGPLEESHLDLAARVVSARVAFTEDSAFVAAQLFNLESAVGCGAGCVMIDAWQGTTTSNSELLRGVATQPGAEQRVSCTA